MEKVTTDPSISFRVTLSDNSESKWTFCNKKVILEHENKSNNPYFQVFSNDDGFLVLKSDKGNAYEEFLNLLEKKFNEETFPLFNYSYSFVFFDAKREMIVCGKDRIGLSSILYKMDDFEISSYGINGYEVPPGNTVFQVNDGKIEVKSFNVPSYAAHRNEDMSVEDAMNLLKEALVKSVDINADVLFSGGLDSTVMAAATAIAGAKKVTLINFCADPHAPDYQSAQDSFNDLKAAFPETEFILKQTVSTATEMAQYSDIIKKDIIPVEATEMNLNIAMTLFNGAIRCDTQSIMSGLGPDELFCGYMSMKKVENVDDEVVKYLNRLWERNGGRDGRVTNHAGKFTVCPYMTPEFIDAALTVPSSMLVKPELPRGTGEKWILRQLAEQLGLHAAAVRPKQAMQFGSKVAKAKWH